MKFSVIELTEEMITHFWDDKDGAFYFTADAMLNLLRLGRITANPEFEAKAVQIERAFSKDVLQTPSAYTQMLAALDFELGNSYEIVIVGNSKSDDTKAMLQALRKQFIPNKAVILRPTNLFDSVLAQKNMAIFFLLC